ncbi:helix-turn-helix domain-containing protein [uncultured Endozoicomonas sp.]|uniref:helix-turn-helix domain-containing protein n=1 Tax=uncultured Endozoicomonas sp. TaxID=432652 RepID=UPI00262D2818|nr:helix-turn-helix domain-containing protein [uncultured Endozoicomonas sp.]
MKKNKIHEKLNEIFKVKTDTEMARMLGVSQPTISNWKSKGFDEKIITKIIDGVIKVKSGVNKADFKNMLQGVFNVSDDSELSKSSGIVKKVLKKWNGNDGNLDAAEIASVFYDAKENLVKDSIINSIQPVAEFIKINPGSSVKKKGWNVFVPEGRNEYEDLRDKLLKSKGIYFFYNSEGKIIYVGKTSENNLWSEINQRYNGERESHKMYSSDQEIGINLLFDSIDNPIKIVNKKIKLREVAAYFSAYELNQHLIHNLEAMLTRALPNNLINIKAEKFKYTK